MPAQESQRVEIWGYGPKTMKVPRPYGFPMWGVSETREAPSFEGAIIITIGQPNRVSQKSQQSEPFGEYHSVDPALRC